MDNNQTNNDAKYEELAIDIIRLNAINQKVAAVRSSFETKPEKAVVRSMYRTALRVAAVFVLLIGSATIYKYASTSDESVYNKLFVNYELTNTRGEQSRENETEAYKNGNWNEVVHIYQTENNKSAKNTFLAAMSEMQLNHFPQAISLFEEILNAKSNDQVFQEETEYYLSLAYLMDHQESKGLQLLNKIKSDKNHTYYPMANKLSGIDMKIIDLKNKTK
jgi:tetratricopeptide (TPR) repeat protein